MTTPPDKKSSELLVRPLKPEEAGTVLPEMLYQALSFPPEAKLPGQEVVFGPNLNRYFDGFGREGDYCLVAEVIRWHISQRKRVFNPRFKTARQGRTADRQACSGKDTCAI